MEGDEAHRCDDPVGSAAFPGHRHGHSHATDVDVDRRRARVVWIVIAAVGVVTLIGLVVLWPSGQRGTNDPALVADNAFAADVVSVAIGPCSFDAATECRTVGIKVIGGSLAGEVGDFELGEGLSGGLRPLNVGDPILVNAVALDGGAMSYSFFDYRRTTPLSILVILFIGAVVLLGQWRGLGAIGGLCASLAVLVVFLLPSLLDGNNPIAAALVASAVIAFIALYLAHGFTVASSVALLGTLASLALTGVLAWVFVAAGRFTGFTDESTYFLAALGTGIDARGLLLAGIVIGSLGVLDDVTVTQVSAVSELYAAQPAASVADVFAAALRIGRDHISSTVNTLFLAYAGASLPLLLLFSEANQSATSVINREVVAVEVMRSLVGSIGLVASVPITTYLATRVLAPRTAVRVVDGVSEAT